MIIDLGILTIKVDVLIVQIINIALLLMFFKKMIGNTLTEEVEKRKAMTLKLEQADKEYASLIAEATEKKEQILDEALAHKKKLVTEAQELAKQEQEKILGKATHEAHTIIEKAQKEAAAQKRDFENSFEQGVKQSAFAMVKKLFASNSKASETYVSGLVDEFSASYKS